MWPQDHIWLYSVKDHQEHKDKLLDQIEDMKDLYGLELNEQGYWYDFECPDLPRTYEKLAKDIMLRYCLKTTKAYHGKFFKIGKIWFQQYPEGTKFGWHTHPMSNFACVYYVELPDDLSTEFFHIGQKDAKEGDVIIFPSFLPHRAPQVKVGRKTIISFNFDINYDRS